MQGLAAADTEMLGGLDVETFTYLSEENVTVVSTDDEDMKVFRKKNIYPLICNVVGGGCSRKMNGGGGKVATVLAEGSND